MSTAEKAAAPSCFPMRNPFGSIKHRGSLAAERTSEKPRPSFRLDGKVAVITGAANGIGAATARLFVSQGARVIIADVQVEAGRKLSSELGSAAHFFRCDVTKEADVAAAVDYAVECWGHLDIMFNNAGVPGPLAGLAEINMEEFDHVMAVHIKGAVLGVKHAARVMIPAGQGVILFSGSTSAQLGGAGPPLHSAAKAAVLCITRSAAAELARHGIRVNAVSPHCVATPTAISNITVEQLENVLSDSGELDALTTEKVAGAVMFLASDDAGLISGHNLVLDGGFSVTKEFVSSDLKAALQKSIGAKPTGGIQFPVGPREASGPSKLPVAFAAKQRELEDEPREKETKKQTKVSKKALAEKEKESKHREEKERTKLEKERDVMDGKARAKQEEARAKGPTALTTNGQAPAKDRQSTQAQALAKEERIQSETIGSPNAGPEPDIPFEYQSRALVTKLGSFMSRGKATKKEGKTEGKPTDPDKVPRKGKQDSKCNDPGTVSKDEENGKPAKKGDIAPEPQPKESSVERINTSLGLGNDSTKERRKEPNRRRKVVSWGKDTQIEDETEDQKK